MHLESPKTTVSNGSRHGICLTDYHVNIKQQECTSVKSLFMGARFCGLLY